MIKSLSIALVFVSGIAGLVSADDLLSGVSVDSIYSSPEATPAPAAQSATPQRLTGPASLGEMLRQVKLDPQTQGEVVSVEFAGRTAELSLTSGYVRIRLVLVLQEGAPESQKMLQMLGANRRQTAAFFAYNAEDKRTELHRFIDNREITPASLQGEIARLAEIAGKSRELWSAPLASAKPAPTQPSATPRPASPQTARPQPAKPQPTKPQSIAKPAAPTLSLVGLWSASRDKSNAFALRLTDKGTFGLAIVSNGKNSQSTGRYTLSGSTLTLKDTKGTTLIGSVRQTQAKEFIFTPQNSSTSMTFKRS